jgi:hypothetical protein
MKHRGAGIVGRWHSRCIYAYGFQDDTRRQVDTKEVHKITT